MAKILNQYPADMDARKVYALTRANAKKIIEAAGSVITPTAYVYYEDPDPKTGEFKKVLTIEADNETFGTISPTFIREFMDAADFFEGNPGAFKVVTGESKNGREFVTLEIQA